MSYVPYIQRDDPYVVSGIFDSADKNGDLQL